MVKHKIFHHFLNVKIASLNCRGLNNNVKRNLLFQKFKQSDITIFCLQETKLNPDQEISYMNEWESGPSFFNSVKGGKCGTAILFNTQEIDVKKSMDELGRVISLDMCIGGKLVHLINTYFPNDDNEQFKFIYDLHPYFHSSYPILWAGDHNITTANTLDRRPRRNIKDRYGKNILQIIKCFDLKDTCRALYPNKDDIFTYTQGLSRSRIDKIIVQDSFNVKSYDHQVIYQSDHEMIISQIQLDEVVEKGYGIWKNNTSFFKNDIFKEEFTELWNEWKTLDNLNCPIRFWMFCKKQIKLFLIDTGKILAERKRKFKQKEIEKLRQLYDRTLTLPTPDAQISMNMYLEHKKTVAKLELDEIKEKMMFQKYREFVEGEKPTKCFFQKFKKNGLKINKIKSSYDQNVVLKTGLADILNIAAQFYQNLYSENNTMNESIANAFLENIIPIDSEHIYEDLCRDFTIEEMYDAIFSFLNAKSPGPDGLSIEFYKCVFSVIKDDLLAMFNTFKRTEFLPSKMKNGLITLIPKNKVKVCLLAGIY